MVWIVLYEIEDDYGELVGEIQGVYSSFDAACKNWLEHWTITLHNEDISDVNKEAKCVASWRVEWTHTDLPVAPYRIIQIQIQGGGL